jgi:hypothetical protein
MNKIIIFYFIEYKNENYIINSNLNLSNKIIKYIIDFHYNIIKNYKKINYYLSIIKIKKINIQIYFLAIYNIYLLHKIIHKKLI